MNGADVVAEILKREGVERIIGFPHSELLESTAKLGMAPIISRTERIAVNIADGFTRVSGGRKLGAVTVQYGPGTECAFGAVAQAYSDNTPLIFLPMDIPSAETQSPTTSRHCAASIMSRDGRCGPNAATCCRKSSSGCSAKRAMVRAAQ